MSIGNRGSLFGLLASLLMAGLFGTVAVTAQEGLTGVRGTVTDPQGKPMDKVTITFVRTDMPGTTYKIKTNKSGQFIDAALPIGTYDVTFANADGKVIFQQKGYQAHGGDIQLFDLDFKAMATQQASSQADLAAGKAPPGMTKDQADAYMKKMKDEEAQNQKLGALNGLLAKNKQLQDTKQWDLAVSTMEQAVALDQTKDVLYAQLGEDYMGAKQYDKAADAYQKAIALAPTKLGYHINLGSAYGKAGKVDDAVAEYTKAEADPTQAAMAQMDAAETFYNASKMDEAVAAFNKIIAADPTNADAYYYKGMALVSSATVDPKTQKMIAPAGMVEALQKCIQLAPNGPNAATAKDVLSQFGVK